MLESVQTNDKLVFADLSEEEKQKRGILGRLYGPCADIIKSTRNGRKYSDKLWEKVFQQPLVEEMFRVGGIPGEIDHPVDRSETDSSRIAIMMPEKPKRGKDGKLMAYFDILNTPCGQIAYQLAKYGFKWGVSSRGEGDIIEDFATGEDSVDPDTYTLNAFDLVLIPSVEQARLDMITEGLDKKNQIALKKSLNESLKKANAGDKKIMEDTLKSLNIDYKDKTLNENVKTRNSVVYSANDTITADNIGVGEAIKGLQGALKQTQNLQKQVKSLQEKLSACNAREAKLKESLQRNVEENKDLKEKLNDVSGRLDRAKSRLENAKRKLDEKSALVESQANKIDVLSKKVSSYTTSRRSLTESASKQDERVKQLTEQMRRDRLASDKKISRLQESLDEAKQNLIIKDKEVSSKLGKANRMIEGYQKLANDAIDRYIDIRARSMGINSAEMKRRLGESYSLEDIDNLCDELSTAQMSTTDLPIEFKTTRRVHVKESKEPIIPKSGLVNDEVDDQLISLAGMYMKGT